MRRNRLLTALIFSTVGAVATGCEESAAPLTPVAGTYVAQAVNGAAFPVLQRDVYSGVLDGTGFADSWDFTVDGGWLIAGDAIGSLQFHGPVDPPGTYTLDPTSQTHGFDAVASATLVLEADGRFSLALVVADAPDSYGPQSDSGAYTMSHDTREWLGLALVLADDGTATATRTARDVNGTITTNYSSGTYSIEGNEVAFSSLPIDECALRWGTLEGDVLTAVLWCGSTRRDVPHYVRQVRFER